jgi:hypothetical protein
LNLTQLNWKLKIPGDSYKKKSVACTPCSRVDYEFLFIGSREPCAAIAGPIKSGLKPTHSCGKSSPK